jgi:hypothetical protein
MNDFFSLPWSEESRQRLDSAVESGLLAALSAHKKGDHLHAKGWDQYPPTWPPAGAIAVLEIDPPPSKTSRAVRLVESGKCNAYNAAKICGVSQAAVSRALKKRRESPVCPHCNQVIRNS